MRDLKESIEDGFLLPENKIFREAKHILDDNKGACHSRRNDGSCDHLNTKEKQELLILWKTFKTYLMVG